jgi:hypothetical protein
MARGRPRRPRSNSAVPSHAANTGYEAEPWRMADALRGSMDAAEYKHVVLGLIFLKYISDAFEERHAQLEREQAEGADPEDPDEYRAASIFWVPREALRGAQGSMFITTSDYQPAAMRFAGRENVRMDLYVSDDVRNWCNDASAGIIEDRTRITTDAEIVRAVREARDNPSRVMHAVCGHTMCYNRFCLVLKESAASGLVIDVPSRIIQHDGYKQAGTEVPDLSDERNVLRTVNTVRRVRKLAANSSFRFSDIDQVRTSVGEWSAARRRMKRRRSS